MTLCSLCSESLCADVHHCSVIIIIINNIPEAQVWITQFYLQTHHTRLSLPHSSCVFLMFSVLLLSLEMCMVVSAPKYVQ